jgi:hypothetical protein
MKYVTVLLLLLSGFCFAQTDQCLIVKQNKGHRVRNGFLFGVGGLVLSKGERFEYVESFNFPNARMKYRGDELQRINDEGVHVIVVNESSSEEINAARQACKDYIARRASPPSANKPSVSADKEPDAEQQNGNPDADWKQKYWPKPQPKQEPEKKSLPK